MREATTKDMLMMNEVLSELAVEGMPVFYDAGVLLLIDCEYYNELPTITLTLYSKGMQRDDQGRATGYNFRKQRTFGAGDMAVLREWWAEREDECCHAFYGADTF